jgi:DNA repair protein RecO (recombination protein O)
MGSGTLSGNDNNDSSDQVTAMVLQSTPMGEYDRRVVLLTRQMGKISCFARRARKQGSALMAATSPFAFGTFSLTKLRSGYIMTDADIDNYFAHLRDDVVTAYYGMYFLEVCEWVTRENNDEAQILLLLYRCCQALQTGKIPNKLIRSVFEIKLVVIEGEFEGVPGSDDGPTNEQIYEQANEPIYESTHEQGLSGFRHKYSAGMRQAVQFIALSSIDNLFSFTVDKEVLNELATFAAETVDNYCGKREFSSLDILKTII